jgi:hypothetical protein
MLIDDNWTILDQNSKTIMPNMIDYLYKIDSTMHEVYIYIKIYSVFK